jgi:ribulose-bisphosphate carboxylase large chain
MREGKKNKRKSSATGQAGPSCDWGGATGSSRGKGRKKAGGQRTRLHRFDRKSHKWSGVKSEAYKKPAQGSNESWADVFRHTLVGGKGENTDFHLRYFEVAPGGMTSLERHEHEHVVVGVRGEGICLVRKKEYELGFMDVIYIPPGAPHQLRNRASVPFGFFCIVDAERDKPVLL